MTATHAPSVIKFPFSIRRDLMTRKIIKPPTAAGASKPEAMVNKLMIAAASPNHHRRPPAFPNPKPASVAKEKIARKYC
jgi:hypothetical protein